MEIGLLSSLAFTKERQCSSSAAAPKIQGQLKGEVYLLEHDLPTY